LEIAAIIGGDTLGDLSIPSGFDLRQRGCLKRFE
jgi:hypothetical protein